MIRAVRPRLCLALVVVSGCGASSTARTSAPGTWSAHPPTASVACGAATPMCLDAASFRVRWPDGARAPASVQASLDRVALDPAEVELGVCASVGLHALHVDGMADTRVEILPGAETRVGLSTAPAGGLASEVTLGEIDTVALVASLAQAELPSVAYDATPEERRVFALGLAAAFDGWRARLARVTQIAETQHDALLHTAATDHEARASSIALTIAEERPSADRVAAIRRAMVSEIEAASAMIAVERTCPLYADDESAGTLASVTVEARPYVGLTTAVVRIRVAIDDVEVLDTGAPRAAELFDVTRVDGVVPPGEHTIVAEVTFADRGGTSPRRPIMPSVAVTIPSTSMRVLVRALGDGTVEITTP